MTGLSYEPARCAVCGHSDAVVVAEREDLRAEIEWLWAYHQRRLLPETPPEHLTDRVAFSEHPPLRLVRCRECGLVYRNPMERPHELQEIYARETPPLEVLRSLHDTQLPAVRRQARAMREILGRGGSGLEIGSYVGAFLAAARECQIQVEGIDINPEANAFTRSLGFVVHDGDINSLGTDRQYDCVTIWNTFDQLADPRATVHAARTLLHPGGVLVIRVPNGGFYERMRSHRATWPLLAQSNLLSFPYRWGFTPHSLTRLVRDHGMQVVRIRGDVLVPIADQWTRRWAAMEERLLKRALFVAASASRSLAPWFELYAVARGAPAAG